MAQRPRVLPPEPSDPPSIDGYRILGRLGKGAMGMVYLASDPDGTEVALKVVQPEYARDPDFLLRFGNEAGLAMRVQGRGTAKVLAAVTTGEHPYLVTELIDGPTLQDQVRENGPLSPADARMLAIGTAAALSDIHAAGVIHRDFKPSNVMLSLLGPRVIDFGIAHALGATTLHTRAVNRPLGTPAYMSPEQLDDQELTSATDIFSWAGVVIYASTGHQPFGSQDALMHVVWRQILEGHPNLDGVPGELRETIKAALTKNPASRPTASRLLTTLAGSEIEPPRRRSWPRVVSVAALVAGLALAGIIVAADTVLSSPPKPKAHQSVPTAFKDLPDQRYTSGLLVKRKWTLSGPQGSQFTETVSANNVTGRRLQVILVEPVPLAIAGNLHAVHFSPAPAREISESTHTVEFWLAVPAGGHESFGYQVKVAPTGAHAKRFTPWLAAFTAMNAHLNTKPTPMLKSLTISPHQVPISVGYTEQLTVKGTVPNGPAPKALLSPVVWTSEYPNVASVSTAGVVMGLSVGQSKVTARVGTHTAHIYVTVTPVGPIVTYHPTLPIHRNTGTSTGTPATPAKIGSVFPSPAPNSSPDIPLADGQSRQQQAAAKGTAGRGAMPWALGRTVCRAVLAVVTLGDWWGCAGWVRLLVEEGVSKPPLRPRSLLCLSTLSCRSLSAAAAGRCRAAGR